MLRLYCVSRLATNLMYMLLFIVGPSGQKTGCRFFHVQSCWSRDLALRVTIRASSYGSLKLTDGGENSARLKLVRDIACQHIFDKNNTFSTRLTMGKNVAKCLFSGIRMCSLVLFLGYRNNEANFCVPRILSPRYIRDPELVGE